MPTYAWWDIALRHSPIMAVALEQFVAQLEDSGILSGDTLKDFLPPKGEPKDAEDLARELVRKKKLTKFQAEEVYRGKGKSLTLGNYVLMEKIGAGGMGQVFKARHRRMDRIVAVKLLPASMTKDQDAIARFEREVKAAAKISHPNIVAAFDADQAGGVHFLVMELVDGSDLSALVKKDGPLPVDNAVNYILQAARGLEAAHAEGIVHRDIKPANLLLDRKGIVKILDMGLARLSGDVDAPTQAELTSTGAVMGTVDYMAPEQALNTKTADARADIYSLGCSLFYLLTGRATFGGDSLMAKLLAHREQPIPALRVIRPEVPESVEEVFCKMLAKKTEDRYQSMTEVIADLEHCGAAQEQSISVPQSLGSSTDEGLTNFLRDTSLAPKKPVHGTKVAKPLSDKDKFERLLIRSGVVGILVLLAGLAWVAVMIVVSLSTKDGTIVVTVNEPGATVQVLDAEGKIEITRQGEKSPITISVDPGKHRLRVEKEGFQFFARDFEIESGGKQPIVARLVPLKKKPAVAGTKFLPPGLPVPAVAGPKQPLAFEQPGFDQWMKQVAGLPAEDQVKAVIKKLQELNAGFDGKETHKVENGVVVELVFITDNVTDISPVRALAGLNGLNCAGRMKGTLTDLTPLKGMALTSLYIGITEVSDLSPLKGMPLISLNCQNTQVSDLSALKGMSLTGFSFHSTSVSDLSPLKGMPLTSLNCQFTQVSDLSPLHGMLLTALHCQGTQVADLSPLSAMQLTSLDCSNNERLSDLSPLRGMPLMVLGCDFKPFRDTELLRAIKTLERINNKPTAEFWKDVDAQQAAFEAWTKQVAAMPAEDQVKAVVKKLQELNQGFDGKEGHSVVNGEVHSFGFSGANVTDISPVRALAGLKVLSCCGDVPQKGLSDLSPLKGLLLTDLDCHYTGVADLSPLRGMPLTNLSLVSTRVSDLSPLTGMPLRVLHCSGEESDLSPLKELRLTNLSWYFKPERDTEILHSIKTLEIINQKPAAEFWKEVESMK